MSTGVASQGNLRQRNVPGGKSTSPAPPVQSDDAVLDSMGRGKTGAKAGSSEPVYWATFALITVLAFVTRFWGISHPNEVVFDEVHFGKFASYYLERTYFFDVHPPFGKLLFAFMGWLVGFDGHFHFENIGDSYIDNNVPYIAFRAMPAILGALTVSVVYLIMWESGYSLPACIVAASLVLLDNAHIGQTRLILLDATLVFAMACSLLCYVRFYKMRHAPFTRKWWKWLILTGFALSCDISTKYVGLFAFVTIGSAVVIDLWGLLDIKRPEGALPMRLFIKHFCARAFGLIIMPFIFYLFWFQVHFTILSKSGPGDDFMTPEFQETLSDNAMLANSLTIDYYDELTIRHKETKTYLHSHSENYPLRYDDGRVSSQGQQVTGYPYNDTNNYWQILPADGEQKAGRHVKNLDLVRLRHVGTDTMLLSHDVASPSYPTNQEFTTVSMADANGKKFNDTLFEVRIENAKKKKKQDFKSISGHFKLIHNPSKVAMWTHTKPLPEWGFRQQEINGNKQLAQSSNVWVVEDIPSIPEGDKRREKPERKIKSLPFLQKWFELQRAMFYHNSRLTSSHPYSSQPYQWPFLLRGVSFWTKGDTRQQIYFLGNPVGWWLASSLLAVFAGVLAADQLSLRRGIDALDRRTRSRLYNSTGFFFLAWATHYIPFFIMGRQLFLHHYLPAHLASCLVAGGLVEFMFCAEPDEAPKKQAAPAPKRFVTARERYAGQSLIGCWIACVIIIALAIASWYFFLPLTYGYPALSVEEVKQRKWLGYDLHFAK